MQGLRFRANRPIHEMRTSVLLKSFAEEDLTAMWDSNMLFRAEQSRVRDNSALFWAGTAYIDDS